MANKNYIPCIMVLFFDISNSCKAGGPWPQSRGHGFTQLGFSSTVYKNIFDADGKTQNAFGKFQDLTFQLYSELGLSKKITLKIIAPYKFVNGESSRMSDSKQNLISAGNIIVGANYLVIDKSIKTAMRVEILSSAIDDKNTPSYYNLKTGYTDWEISPFVSIGYSASSGKFYWYADIGAGFTNNSVLKFYGEAGQNILKTLKAAAVTDARIPFGVGKNISENNAELSPSFLYDPFQQYIGTGIKLIYTYKNKFGISGSAFGAFLAKRIAEAPAFNVGLFYKW